MPAYNGRIAVVGVAESAYGRVPNMTGLQSHAQAIQRAGGQWLAQKGYRRRVLQFRHDEHGDGYTQ